MVFKIMTKENNAAVLIHLTDANFKNLIDDGIPLRNFEFRKKNCSIVNKRLFLPKFSAVRFFTSCVKNGI